MRISSALYSPAGLYVTPVLALSSISCARSISTCPSALNTSTYPFALVRSSAGVFWFCTSVRICGALSTLCTSPPPIAGAFSFPKSSAITAAGLSLTCALSPMPSGRAPYTSPRSSISASTAPRSSYSRSASLSSRLYRDPCAPSSSFSTCSSLRFSRSRSALNSRVLMPSYFSSYFPFSRLRARPSSIRSFSRSGLSFLTASRSQVSASSACWRATTYSALNCLRRSIASSASPGDGAFFSSSTVCSISPASASRLIIASSAARITSCASGELSFLASTSPAPPGSRSACAISSMRSMAALLLPSTCALNASSSV